MLALLFFCGIQLCPDGRLFRFCGAGLLGFRCLFLGLDCGGKVAGIARQALEAETGKPVITEKNAFDFQQLVTDIVEDAAELPEQSAEKKEK